MSKPDRHILYEALLTRDARYDGKLFFGVTSTGIYCRPICPAPKPKPENVIYFAGSDLARLAGFRPCKRCRPEARPGSPAWQGTGATVSRAVRLLAQGDAPDSLAALADRLGVTDRHLRRLFQKHLGKTPMAVRHANRMAIAKALLKERDATMADIAFAAGFGSLRRFNDSFKKSHGVSPGQWRQDNVAHDNDAA